jgi:hypothetical protein
MLASREYVSSVILVITGDSLIPPRVSQSLRLEPDQAWQKGEPKAVGDGIHQCGGWKKFLPEAMRSQPFEEQLGYWAALLGDRVNALDKLTQDGHQCLLSCFVTTDETASIVIPSTLQHSLARLNVPLEISVWVGSTDLAPGRGSRP